MIGFLFAYWQWILIALVSSVALGYFAFIMRNLWAALAVVGLIGAVIAAGIVYKRGADDANAKWRAQQQAEFDRRKANIEKAALDDAKRAEAAERRAKELQELIDAIPDNPALCFDSDVIKRLQRIR